jgi:hypothetical protein
MRRALGIVRMESAAPLARCRIQLCFGAVKSGGTPQAALEGGRVFFVLKLAVSLRQCKIHAPKSLMRRDGRRSAQRGIDMCLGS